LKLTTRVHSLGVFSYGGMIANENPSFDVNITYERKQWGSFLFKAVDLYDVHSHYNFTLALAYCRIRPSQNISITPYAGFIAEQRKSIVDHDSDGMIILVTAFKLDEKFTLEHCGRFSNTFFKTEWFDWLNRLRLLYSKEHIDVVISAWHNNKLFDHSTHTSFGFTAGYGRIKISEKILLSTGITGIMMTENSDEKDLAAMNGLALTIAATWD
jgi:hypothetical protein